MYVLSAALCLGLHAAQRLGFVEAPEEEDFRELQEKELSDLQQGGTPKDETEKMEPENPKESTSV